MVIDIIYIILLLMAVWKGYSRGFVVAVFSFLAILIGLAAAMKFSVVVSQWLAANTHIGAQWLPVISFLIIMIIVTILIRLAANMIQASLRLVMLGWLNRLAGIALYAIIYTIIFSIILFYAQQMDILKPDLLQASHTYSVIQPWGPQAIGALSYIIPFFKDMFAQLEQFFDSLAHKATA